MTGSGSEEYWHMHVQVRTCLSAECDVFWCTACMFTIYTNACKMHIKAHYCNCQFPRDAYTVIIQFGISISAYLCEYK